MPTRRIVALLLALPLVLPVAAAAQSASTEQEAQLRIEAKRKRLIVRPDPGVTAAAREADRVAEQSSAAELTRETNDPVRRRPQFDYDVTSAITARNAQRALRR